MLVSFSLAITILNTKWVTKRFSRIIPNKSSQETENGKKTVKDKYIGAAQGAMEFLCEAIQAPIRISQFDYAFSSLIALPENCSWWKDCAESLKSSKRPVSFSLVAQIALALISWLLTIGTSYQTSQGGQADTLHLSSGTLWIWLLPVIFGWIFVGTQARQNTIDKALKGEKAYQVLPKDTTQVPSGSDGKKKGNTGVRVNSGLPYKSPQGPQHRSFPSTSTEDSGVGKPDDTCVHPPEWLRRSIPGDEAQQGPVFNYARIFTWWSLANIVFSAFKSMINEATKLQEDENKRKQQEKLPEVKETMHDPSQVHMSSNRTIRGHSRHQSSASSARTCVHYNTSDSNSVSNQNEIGAMSSDNQTARSDPSHLRVPSTVSNAPTCVDSNTSDSNSNYQTISNQSQSQSEIEETQPHPTPQVQNAEEHSNLNRSPKERLSNQTAEETAKSCLETEDNKQISTDTYQSWETLSQDFDLQYNIIAALIISLIIQWGTTGSAFLIAMQTEVKGLGCRSGSYLIYGILATISFIFLFSSVFFSHAAMLIYQEKLKSNPFDPKEALKKPTEYTPRNIRHIIYCILAVSTRIMGKFIAFCNAFWLLLSSLLELAGFYNSCWCLGSVLQWKDMARIMLPPSSTSPRIHANEGTWGYGIAMSLSICLISMGLFWYFSKQDEYHFVWKRESSKRLDNQQQQRHGKQDTVETVGP